MRVLQHMVGAYNIADGHNFLIKSSKNNVKHYFQKLKIIYDLLVTVTRQYGVDTKTWLRLKIKNGKW
jgi:hypothetical protein